MLPRCWSEPEPTRLLMRPARLHATKPRERRRWATIPCMHKSLQLTVLGFVGLLCGVAAALPLSLVDVMRASVQILADGIWAAEGADRRREPLSLLSQARAG